MADGYRIARDGRSITCLTCRTLSFNPNDIRNRYCGFCHKYHEDPPPRLSVRWLGRLADWARSVSRPAH